MKKTAWLIAAIIMLGVGVDFIVGGPVYSGPIQRSLLMRPSQDSARVKKGPFVFNNQTASSTLYTVTSGKTFYLTDYRISIIAETDVANSFVSLVDSTTARIGWMLADSAGSLAIESMVHEAHSFSEPPAFTVNVQIQNLGGSPRFNGSLWGYEE